MNSSETIKQINTDALTVLGEKISEAADLKEATLTIITNVALDLGEDNQCVIDAVEFLTQSTSAAGVSMSACAEQTIYSLNTITSENVIPYTTYIQRRSTTASHFTMTVLATHNPITEAAELVAYLEEAFEGNLDAWENYAKLIMESELEYMGQLGGEAVTVLDACVESVFATLVSITDAIAASVILCEA